MKETASGPDRVWFSSDVKINLGNYQSASVAAGMSTDVDPAETVEDAFKRCRLIVEKQIKAEATKICQGLYKDVL